MRATSFDYSEVQAECRAVAAPGSAQKARSVRNQG